MLHLINPLTDKVTLWAVLGHTRTVKYMRNMLLIKTIRMLKSCQHALNPPLSFIRLHIISFKLTPTWSLLCFEDQFGKSQRFKPCQPCWCSAGRSGFTYYVFLRWRTLGSWSRWWALDGGCSRACRRPWAGHRGADGTAARARVEASRRRGSAEPPCLREKGEQTCRKPFSVT